MKFKNVIDFFTDKNFLGVLILIILVLLKTLLF